jgi:UDP-N-acetylmuramyl pentapeptide phosphotransferase/UDP-N-acetylglucosamine-1-phosphate transferase
MGDLVLPTAVALATGVLSCSTTRALIPILHRRNILDHPNERSSHHVSTPRGGGIAVIGSLLLVWVLLAGAGLVTHGVIGVATGAALLAAISWVDDLQGLSPILRLLAQLAAVTIGIMTQDWAGALLGFAVIGLLWLWWINLFNFMDGIDGIAGAEATSIAGGLLLFASVGTGADASLAMLAAAVVGVALGFLVWNWSPARIFLGDVGSAPLGYLLGFLLVDLVMRGFWKVALILPLYFLADATITLVRRLLRRERIWQAHREHFYQQAVRAGLRHAAVVERVIAANLVLIGCSWASENGWGLASLALSAATVAILLAMLGRGR